MWNGIQEDGSSLNTMKKSIDSKGLRIYLPFAVFALMLFGASSANAQNLAVRRNAPSAESDGSPKVSPSDPDSTTQHNAVLTQEDQKPLSPLVRESIHAESNNLPRSEINKLIVKMIERMPTGGEYRASRESTERLATAIRAKGNELDIDCQLAKPSFCSSATYLLFLSVLEQLNENKAFTFKQGVPEMLLVKGQQDGDGVWGRWNANGPGTARLFEELQLGNNFTSIDQAEAGDFLKIFWNDRIGSREFGHSVVFLGRGNNGSVIYWSSNKKGGYGCAEVPQTKIKRTLFSHLSDPSRINQIRYAPRTEEYLASMLGRSSTPEEMYEKVGVKESATAEPIPAWRVGKNVKPNETDSKTGERQQ
jgi:hypothetical protein